MITRASRRSMMSRPDRATQRRSGGLGGADADTEHERRRPGPTSPEQRRDLEVDVGGWKLGGSPRPWARRPGGPELQDQLARHV